MKNTIYNAKTQEFLERTTYFDEPTQVGFRDPYYELEVGETFDDVPTIGGIAYCDEVICGCCGGILHLQELFDTADENDFPMSFTIFPWVSISDEILGN